MKIPEAQIRFEKYGPNAITPKPPVWWVYKALAHIAGGFSLLLWAGGLLCFIVYAIDASIPDLTLGIVLCVVVLATGIFSYLQELKSDAVLDAFMKLTPDRCYVKRDGEEVELEAIDLTIGDVVKLTGGQKVPADVVMIVSQGVKVDNSSLTGESEPLKRTTECTDDMPTRSKNVAFFGTAVHEGAGYGVVVRIGDKTTMGDIARSVQETEKPQALMKMEIEKFVHIISAIALTIGIIFFAVGMAMGYEVKRALIFTIGIIVANVPEGLLATVTVALTITAQRMASKEVHVKSTLIVETLGSITCIASDKTGTLTQNRMSVVSAIYPDSTIEVDQKHPKRKSLKADEDDIPTIQLISNPKYVDCQKHLIEVAGLCNHATFQQGQKDTDILHRKTKGDASESALLKFSHSNAHVETLRDDYPEVGCVAFNSTNKFMVTIHKIPSSPDYRVCIKGAPERVMERCSTATDPTTNGPTPFTDALKKKVTESNYSLAGNGERVLAFGEQILKGLPADYVFDTDDITATNFPLDGFRFIGMLALEDPHRPEVPGAVINCHNASIRVIMVTGDHPLTARSIASKINIVEKSANLDDTAPIYDMKNPNRMNEECTDVVVTGDLLGELKDDDWKYILSRQGIVFSRTLPTQKQEIVEKLQLEIEKGGLDEVVAVTGDGVNDSPALKAARVGIAMGTGAQVAHDAADLILMDDNFASIVAGIEEGRLIFANLKKSISYTLTSNIPEIIPFLAQICLKLPLGLTTIMILCIDLGTDILPAISFAYEVAENDIMAIPPRDRHKDVLVTGTLISWSYLQIGIIQAMASFTTFFNSLEVDGFSNDMVLNDGMGFDWSKSDEDVDPDNSCFKSTTTVSSDGCATFNERTKALRRAQTAFLACIVICQIGCGMAAKTRLSSILTHGFSNPVFNYGLLQETSLIVLLVYVPGLHYAFSTEAIHPQSWGIGVPFAVVLLLYDECRKFAMRTYPDSDFKKWIYY